MVIIHALWASVVRAESANAGEWFPPLGRVGIALVYVPNGQISVEIVAPHNIPKAGCSEGKTKNTMSTNLP